MIRMSLVIALGVALLAPIGARAEPLVAAAANVQGALDEIIAGYTAQTGLAVRVSYGSTGNLLRQIREGAPFDLFLSADEASAEALVTEGLTQGAAQVYAQGRLALLVPKGGAVGVDAQLDGLRAALAAGTVKRFAIANPEHAPYGLRAREALTHEGLWEALQPKLVLGENVAQAAQFVTSGNADAGIAALSLALSPAVAALADHVTLPAEWHAPLTQSLVVLTRADAETLAFAAYLTGDAARAIWAASGYGLP